MLVALTRTFAPVSYVIASVRLLAGVNAKLKIAPLEL